jgi:DNA-binding HxlR family transcriptional regulator
MAIREPTSRRERCPVGSTLDIVGDRWTLLVVRDLLRGYTHFNELRYSVEGISSNVLAERLRRLEREGIVERRYAEGSSRAPYVLTPKGHALGVVVGALSVWGQRYTEHDLTIVDIDCGHSVEVGYRCARCDREVPRARLRVVQA